MAFTQEPTKVPVALGNIVIQLKDAIASGDDPAYQSAHVRVTIIYDVGADKVLKDDLGDHVTPQEQANLMAFLDTVRLRWAGELIPE